MPIKELINLTFLSSSDKYQKWRYTITEFKLLNMNNKKDIDILPDRVRSISIVHNYETNLFPVFRLELVTSPSVYYNIIKNKSNIKIKIRMQKYYTEVGENKKSLYRDVINDTFDLILDDNDYDVDRSVRENSKKNDYKNITVDNSNDLSMSNNVIELFLFKSDIINKMNATINSILSNATVTDGIQYIAYNAGLSNILMSPADNIKNIKELIIPPLKAKEAIMWLNNYYGIYKNGMLMYNDFINNILYILPYTGDCTAYKSNEIKETNILIPKKSNVFSSELCSIYRRDHKDIYYILCTNNIAIKNESISFDIINSINSTTVDSYSGEININKNNYGNTKIIENKTENEWYSNIYTTLSSGKQIVIDLLLSHYDIESLKPNKKIKIIFEDSTLSNKYKGNFLLTYLETTFLKDGSDFTINSTARIKYID